MPGLAASRWASRIASTTTTTTTTTYYSSISDLPARNAQLISSRTSRDELTRYTKLVRRLKWKLPYLASGYQQAVQPSDDPASAVEAELMFKLDFFEYYMLIERALVHLLGVFGIERGGRWSQNEAGIAGSKWNSAGGVENPNMREHRYHANVLEAFESSENPLYPVLGTGDVRRQLRRAKDLRNRWKNADNGLGTSHSNKDVDSTNAPPPLPLETYNLEHILTTIFEGFDKAFAIAERAVLEEQRKAAPDAGSDADMVMRDEAPYGPAPVSDEEQWEFIVDAMDWDAV